MTDDKNRISSNASLDECIACGEPAKYLEPRCVTHRVGATVPRTGSAQPEECEAAWQRGDITRAEREAPEQGTPGTAMFSGSDCAAPRSGPESSASLAGEYKSKLVASAAVAESQAELIQRYEAEIESWRMQARSRCVFGACADWHTDGSMYCEHHAAVAARATSAAQPDVNEARWQGLYDAARAVVKAWGQAPDEGKAGDVLVERRVCDLEEELMRLDGQIESSPCAPAACTCGAPRGSDHGITCPAGRSDTPGETDPKACVAQPGDPTLRHAVAWMRATYPMNEHAREWAAELERVFLRGGR
jgi:hypothetical protein